MIDDFTSGIVLVAAAIIQAAFATQYDGTMRLLAIGGTGFMLLCAVALLVQS